MTVDDSVVARLVVAESLRGEPDLVLAGFAQNGSAALDKLTELDPDVIVLDVEMPVMDGLETLTELRRRGIRVPVIMFSTLTGKGAATTVEALTRGASDYVQKPSATSTAESVAVLKAELLPKLRALAPRVEQPVPVATRQQAAVRERPRAGVATQARRPELVVIGISTGGPNALSEMLPGLAADLPVPVLIVQHMPPMFTTMLAGRLDARCPLPVAEAAGGELLLPSRVWVAPGGRHLVVQRTPAGVVLGTHEGEPENSCRPAVDVLFRSAAEVFRGAVLAVVMTGMGRDGFAGSAVLKSQGAQVLAQDQDSSVVWGMPRFVAENGLADAVLPLDRIAEEINRRVHAPHVSLTSGR